MFKWIKKFFNRRTVPSNVEAVGGFSISTPYHSEISGHFWGDPNELTPEVRARSIIHMMFKYKKKFNWTDEEFCTQLCTNLSMNYNTFTEEDYLIQTIQIKYFSESEELHNENLRLLEQPRLEKLRESRLFRRLGT